jgi:rod shape determining protein RodA
LFSGFIFAFFSVAVPALLIFLQPDLGSALILFPIFLAMIYYAGVRPLYLYSLFGLGAAAAPVFWHLLKDYQRTRLLVFINPNLDPLGAGYTIIQSKIAIGSGRFFGKGWLSGTQNQLNFLPERHTDFIFSVIGEEWGFVGSLMVAGLFLALIIRILNSISETTDNQSKLLLLGIATFFSVQVVINLAMTIGMVPVVGLPLPFISYGGSSMLTSCIMVGLFSSINRAKRI